MKSNIYSIATSIALLASVIFAGIKLSQDETTIVETHEEKESKTSLADGHIKADSVHAIFEDFYYDIGTRFGGVSMERVREAQSLADFLEPLEEFDLETLRDMSLQSIVYERRDGQRFYGLHPEFNPAQKSFLKNLNYSDNFMIEANFIEVNEYSQEIPELYTPHFTVVPEVQAFYVPGKRNLLQHIRKENAPLLEGISEEEVGFAMIYFTVKADGKVGDIYMENPSPFPAMNQNLINILENLPGEWSIARNEKGEAVDQQFVLRLGMAGC